jgi:hypothetical protein
MVYSCSLVESLAKQHTQINKSIRNTQRLVLIKKGRLVATTRVQFTTDFFVLTVRYFFLA